MTAEILVAGALHWDTIVRAPRLPARDETLAGQDVAYAFGGKGGNQALAAARHGARVAMAGCVGTDPAGANMLAALDAAGVDRSRVAEVPGPSGMSVAILDPDGGYGAVIVSAANLAFDPARIALPPDGAFLLLQNETAEAHNLTLARKARAAGMRVVLNAAPARPFATALRANVDLVVVNRLEAEMLSGRRDPDAALADLSAKGAAIVTLGADGLIWQDGAAQGRLPARKLAPNSTHGAGDAFLGALAARLSLGAALQEGCAYANVAAGLHVATPPEARGSITAATVLAHL
ncbi:MAG: PfkB family carbohydrate kinase [Pseudomonadota bacterium]